MKIGILSDTHIPTIRESIPPALLKAFENVDLIIHAGDLVRLEVLDSLTSLAPVKAVSGNMDPAEVKRELPDKLCISIEGIKDREDDLTIKYKDIIIANNKLQNKLTLTNDSSEYFPEWLNLQHHCSTIIDNTNKPLLPVIYSFLTQLLLMLE